MTKQVVARFPKAYKPLNDPYRYKVLYGGRAAARSWTIARNLLIRGTQQKEFILCTRELQKSIKQSVHRLLKDQIRLLGLESYYEVTEQSIKGRNGTEFMFLGVKANPEEIRSTEGVTVAWIEEGHSLSEQSWDIIDPTIRADGSEIWISFNTRFKFDYLYQLFIVNKPPPQSLILKTSYRDNPYLSDVLHRQLENLKKVDYEKYLHIWEGELKQLAEGAIFGNQIRAVHKDGRLTFIPVQANSGVTTFFDIGKNDETAIWFVQRVGKEYRFIDYFEGRLEEVEYYTKVIRKLDYLYDEHYLPHDAAHDRLGMVRNIEQQFNDGGINPTTIVPRIAHKATAIELARESFVNCWFHKGDDGDKHAKDCDGYLDVENKDMKTRARRMERGYSCLCNYRYKYNDENGVYAQVPVHDRASNACDAFQGFAQSGYTDGIGSQTSDWSVAING